MVLDPKLFWIYASPTDAAAVNCKGTPLARYIRTFLSSGKEIGDNGPKRLPRNPLHWIHFINTNQYYIMQQPGKLTKTQKISAKKSKKEETKPIYPL